MQRRHAVGLDHRRLPWLPQHEREVAPAALEDAEDVVEVRLGVHQLYTSLENSQILRQRDCVERLRRETPSRDA